jgi:hypothetical protein
MDNLNHMIVQITRMVQSFDGTQHSVYQVSSPGACEAAPSPHKPGYNIEEILSMSAGTGALGDLSLPKALARQPASAARR